VIAQEEYARVREDAARFVVKPGHDIAETEHVEIARETAT
jgi:hypothetical protein